MKLTRPLVFFDLETTGLDAATARIVQLAFIKMKPNGDQPVWQTLVNPCMPIPAEATAVHGITDDKVKTAPTFQSLAVKLRAALEGCDLAGYNVRRFDIPLLVREFERSGLNFSLEGRSVVDPMAIFHAHEKRDLSSAVKFYRGREMVGAHDAMADVRASMDVLFAQIDRYTLPAEPEELHKLCAGDAIDIEGKFVWKDGDAVCAFGKNVGVQLQKIDPGFLRWMLDQDFSSEVKALVRDALAGKFPIQVRK